MGQQVSGQDLLLLRDWSWGQSSHTHTHTLRPLHFSSRFHLLVSMMTLSCLLLASMCVCMCKGQYRIPFLHHAGRCPLINRRICSPSSERARAERQPVVLGGSARSFITQRYFELSNYTQAEYFTEINLLPALRTGFFFFILLPAFFLQHISHR